MSVVSDRRVKHLLGQQAAIAEFGLHALRASSLDEILGRACKLVTEGLEVSAAKILEFRRGEGSLLVRAGYGWQPGIVGRARIGAHRGSPAGFALQTDAPVVSADIDKETRFEIPDLLRRHGIRSMVNVMIRTRGEPFGVLEADHREVHEFNEDDTNYLTGFANLLGAAVERFQATEALRRIAESRELLLRELHHRVSNNLQQISSLLRVQQRKSDVEAEIRTIDTISARLNAMRLLYRELHIADSELRVDLPRYLQGLVDNLAQILGAKKVRFDLQFPKLMLPLDIAVPLGLIVNEFVTNSLKYAFPEGPGKIELKLEKTGGEEVKLALKDDGIGMPEETPSNGIGLLIIARLAEQIGAHAEWGRAGGTRLTLQFRT